MSRLFRLADGEAREPLRLLVRDLNASDGRSARPLTAEAEERLHLICFSLEDGLDCTVRPVPRPAGDATNFRRARDRDAESDALNGAVHDDLAAHHDSRRLRNSVPHSLAPVAEFRETLLFLCIY